jgi:CheY-like chemotaxis protein
MDEEHKKVLAIDDEAEILDSVREALEAEGYDVRTATSAIVGFELAQEFKPDIVFLDIRMPHMDGFQFAKKLAMDPEIGRTPVVMISAYGDTENVFKAQSVRNVCDFIIKPFQAADLIDLVRRHT